VFLLLIASTRAGAPEPLPQPAAPSWLAGCWHAPLGDGRALREVWLGPVDGTLVGAALGELPKGAATWEHLRIATQDGVLTFFASPSGQATTAFAATRVTAESATFENPKHDFPQRIAYTRVPTGLKAQVESRDGESWKGFTLDFVPCPR
jgi:hypothetical protein